jgi:serine/threonine protein kinase
MATYRQGDEPVPGYKLMDFLGQGSYGAVWKAVGPGRIEVALKFISLDNKQGIKEFKAIGLVKKLRHPNIVPIHAIWLKDQNGNLLGDGIEGDSISINLMGSKDLVIAMGLGDKSLSQRLEECVKGTGMPLKELLRHMAEAAKGIDYLNEPVHPPGNSPIIHCDIKPANLLIVGGGVQVCDYGVARALSTDMRKTYGAGTPAYAAPELINNDPAPQTDQYSLAITYVEMRTGLLPFDESKALVANLTGQLDLSRLPYEERGVIQKATHMQPGRRFATCEEFVDELRSAAGVNATARTGAVPLSAMHRPDHRPRAAEPPGDALPADAGPAGDTGPAEDIVPVQFPEWHGRFRGHGDGPAAPATAGQSVED